MTGTLTDTLTHRQLLRRPFRQTHRHETRIRQTHRQGHRHMQPSSFWGVTRAYVSNLVNPYYSYYNYIIMNIMNMGCIYQSYSTNHIITQF